MKEWVNALVGFLVVLVPMMLFVMKLDSKPGEESPSITKYFVGLIAFAVLICRGTFMIALYTLPIWGGFLILRAIFA